jgi:serine/threonine protein kinase
MDAPVCNNCSTPLPVGSKYCSECGTPVPGQVAPRWADGYPTDLRQALQMATAGEYEIHHELGRGGMGSVFLAREIGLDRLVAIKVLPPSLMFDEGLIERFKREARMVAKLHHPNIIPVYRVHHSHNLAFYTMHFVPGRSLSEIMGRNRVPSLQEVERTMLEAAAGLGYAHKRGVIHRDVKPANVLIDAEGHVHLTDFGIAKALVGSTQLTETGAVIGTPQYMAPEQCEGRLVDGRADQYSLAAVGYQLLTGQPPFQSESMKELLYHHLFTPPRPINALRADTPLGLRDAIHKALSKDPVDRFDTMEDLAMAIEGKGPPIFVRWIDKAQERRRTPPGGKLYRRATDPPTTERLLQSPWVSEGNREVLAGSRISVHRRAMGALAATVLIIGAVAVLALSRGAGLAGSLGRDTSAADASEDAVSQAGLEPGTPGAPLAGREEPGTPPAESEGAVPAPAMGRLSIAGDLPPGAGLVVDGEALDVSLDGGATIELPAGSHSVVISAAGFSPFSRDIYVEAGAETGLQASLERLPATRPAAQPVARRDTRPPLPADLLDELQAIMDEGRVLHTIGRYLEAGDAFKEVRDRAEQAIRQYRDAEALRTLVDKAAEDLGKAREACRIEKQPVCP